MSWAEEELARAEVRAGEASTRYALANEDVVWLLNIIDRLVERAVKQDEGFGHCPFCSYSWRTHDADCPSQQIWEIRRKYEVRNDE